MTMLNDKNNLSDLKRRLPQKRGTGNLVTIAARFVIGVVMATAVRIMIALLIMQLTCHLLGMAPTVTMAEGVILRLAKVAIIMTFICAVSLVTTALEVKILGIVFFTKRIRTSRTWVRIAIPLLVVAVLVARLITCVFMAGVVFAAAV